MPAVLDSRSPWMGRYGRMVMWRIASLVLLILVTGTATKISAEKKKRPANESYALVAGTVFREPGFAVAGAEVILNPGSPEGGRKQKSSTNFRGEFTFRVPPVEAKYEISVAAKGLKSETKPAATRGGEERIDVTFLLSPESK